jgi:hypothetical protein
VPLSRDLASQERETLSRSATWAGCSKGSISLFFAGALMAHLLRVIRMDARCRRGFRKMSVFLRQIGRFRDGADRAALGLVVGRGALENENALCMRAGSHADLRLGLRVWRTRSKRRSPVCSCRRSRARVTVSWLTFCGYFSARLISLVNAFIPMGGFHFR